MNAFLHDDIAGLKLSQNKYIEDAFSMLKNDYGQPENIIEIGTCFGGFALFLAKLFPKSNVYTFDIADWGGSEYVEKRNQLYLKYGIVYHMKDCFNSGGEIIKDLLTKKSILLCDGGLKETEFSTFINYIQPDSIIMAHDYGKSENYFRKNIQNVYWSASFEFDGSKFDNECNKKGFTPYFQTEFDKAVWYIRKKN